MILAEVLGKVWPDRIVATLQGRRLVLIREHPDGPQRVAVDLMNAGTGSTVLVATDEAAAAATGEATVDAAVVALVADQGSGVATTD
ncbi:MULTISPECIES: EutN/CcmL family microcompartment protein [Micromonosporaceae]|uniref:EutN/CcmL family microcompartment protein n=1 Tax=Micromonosporaceae TaxID=28056 RepID=UPI002416EDD0|nr:MULTISPECIES: EutN/CcmL family microcompartment protein [unclassified Solwaraspora]MDG4771086.1 EutN/CcmL family microcompartment protein [Solwaraspora sp. WMMD792]WFE20397.1 EutN/CcmL family microcompartment protein [Solwaraspora sp. WMMD937]